MCSPLCAGAHLNPGWGYSNAKAQELTQWADRLAGTRNILSMDAQTFRVWAGLMHHPSDALFEDAMIAATAQVHQLTVVTRNTRDFAAFKVPLLDPFKSPK